MSDVLLSVRDLRTHFVLPEGTVRAVDGVDLRVPVGQTVCVVGESGCGKSVTARSVMGLIDPPGRIVGGQVMWRRKNSDEVIDLTTTSPATMREIRGGEIAMVFQEPMASLSPMYTVGSHLIEAIRLHSSLNKAEARQLALELLQRVGIPRPDQRIDAYSFQLSGGLCQRVMIALALAANPSLLIADEPTTALDVTTQSRIVDLLRDLQADTGMALLFITHDLGLVAEIADHVVVMYLGTVVEEGAVDDVFHDPKHPYTRMLLDSIPVMGAGQRRPPHIRGRVPHPLNRPPGCPFHPRCDSTIPGLCDRMEPPMVELGSLRRARCVLHDADLLAGVVPANEGSDDDRS